MLGSSLNINFPYGMKRNEQGFWSFFNREYLPLGFNDMNLRRSEELFVYTNYGKLKNTFLISLTFKKEDYVYDDFGDIHTVYFYCDRTNPINLNTKENWDNYLGKLKKLSSLIVK